MMLMQIQPLSEHYQSTKITFTSLVQILQTQSKNGLGTGFPICTLEFKPCIEIADMHIEWVRILQPTPEIHDSNTAYKTK